MVLAADTVKRVALELGGKSANVILDDADLEKAIPAGIFACYLNSGQTCSALTRISCPAPVSTRSSNWRWRPRTFTPGDPFERATRLGPFGLGHPARAGAGVHHQGHRRGCRAC